LLILLWDKNKCLSRIERETFMAYMPHINNLYKDQELLMFKEAYALEKIHGTNAKIEYHPQTQELKFFSGGTKHETFVKLFDQEKLKADFVAMGILDRDITVFGESYGGKEQGMSHTYGTIAKFVVFDVKIGEFWLDVPKAEKVAKDLGLEFVHYVKIPTDLTVLDAWRDAPSVQAIRNGISQLVPFTEHIDGANYVRSEVLGGVIINPKKREGIVLRPLIELRKNNGERLICKHKGDDFKETATPRPVVDPAKQKILEDAQSVADDFATPMRLQHVLDKLPGHCMEKMKEIIAAMVEDVNREGKDEFVASETVNKAIGKKTAILYKEYLKNQIGK
jgi:hypothetical protein